MYVRQRPEIFIRLNDVSVNSRGIFTVVGQNANNQVLMQLTRDNLSNFRRRLAPKCVPEC